MHVILAEMFMVLHACICNEAITAMRHIWSTDFLIQYLFVSNCNFITHLKKICLSDNITLTIWEWIFRFFASNPVGIMVILLVTPPAYFKKKDTKCFGLTVRTRMTGDCESGRQPGWLGKFGLCRITPNWSRAIFLLLEYSNRIFNINA